MWRSRDATNTEADFLQSNYLALLFDKGYSDKDLVLDS